MNDPNSEKRGDSFSLGIKSRPKKDAELIKTALGEKP